MNSWYHLHGLCIGAIAFFVVLLVLLFLSDFVDLLFYLFLRQTQTPRTVGVVVHNVCGVLLVWLVRVNVF